MIKLKWHGDLPENLSDIEERVIKDLKTIHDDLEEDPSALIFHHVFLSKNHDEPLVFVWGEEKDKEYYQCEYVENPNWKTINSFDDDEEIC
jgi:hypothetical protein